MIRNIVFDMGNVLLRFDPQLFIERAGVEDEADRKLLQKELFRSLEWVQMDRACARSRKCWKSSGNGCRIVCMARWRRC